MTFLVGFGAINTGNNLLYLLLGMMLGLIIVSGVMSEAMLRRLWGERMKRYVRTNVLRFGADPTEHLCLTIEGTLYAFGPSAR